MVSRLFLVSNVTACRAAAVVLPLIFIAPTPLVLADNTTGSTGASSPVENRQPTQVLRYIIALQGIFPDDHPELTPTEQTVTERDAPFLGEIRLVSFNFAPKGWAFCEGQLLSINQNQALFSLLQNTYGGDGRVNFALPDLRNRTPIGAGQGPGLPDYPLGAQVGSATPSLTKAQLPVHNHTLPSGTTALSGNGAAFDNRQASLGLRFLMRANGEIIIVAWPYQPTGWVPCDGRLLTSADHTLLYNNIGTTYGGDSTNFALPDFRGRAPVGDDGGVSWPRGLAYGSNDTFLSIADIPAHTHTITGGTTGSTGGPGGTVNNYQPSLVVRWLISFFGIFPSSTGTTRPSDSVTQPDAPDQTTSGFPYVGEIRLIGGATATGLSADAWKLLDGQLYPISDNETLFQLIGTTYGGDGNQTFGIPDLRGRVSVEVSDILPLASIVGSQTLQISLSQLAAHAHLVDLGITGIQHFSDGSATIFLKGMAGSLVKVELSDDGVTWTTVGSGAVQLTNGTGSVTDPNTSGSTKRFYRAR